MLTTRNAAARVWTGRLTLVTGAGPHFIEITSRVRDLVRDSGLHNGLALVFSQHTTASILISQRDAATVEHLREALERVAPAAADYRHNDFTVRTVNMTEDEVPNGHSHCQHLLLRTSETLPIVAGELILSPEQGLFLIELDHPRTRDIIVQIIGE